VTGWLVKTEPGAYSFDDLLRDCRTTWDGVSNALALKHLRAVRKGDPVLVYHTGDEKALVGLARAVTDAYPDPRDGRLTVFDLEAEGRLPRPVTLAEVKADAAFAAFPLVRMPRLSVMPVGEAEWSRLLGLAGS
jgi:predicted RNA-binding protein with PUA-like domain